MTNSEQTKVCTTCGKKKDLSLFNRCSRIKSGYRAQCKKCHKEYNARPEVKERKKKYNREYERNRKATDPLYKFKKGIQTNISQGIKSRGYRKKSRSQEILGCSYEFFRGYIQKQFKNGMSWDNYGEWHLDHIKPISLGKTEEEVIQLYHYTNFQPLWAKDNVVKYNKIISKQLRFL